jgi:hypothetical protein
VIGLKHNFELGIHTEMKKKTKLNNIAHTQVATTQGYDMKGTFWWRSILRLLNIFEVIAQVQLGTRDTILFWEDLWNGRVLRISFSEIFSFAKDKKSQWPPCQLWMISTMLFYYLSWRGHMINSMKCL